MRVNFDFPHYMVLELYRAGYVEEPHDDAIFFYLIIKCFRMSNKCCHGINFIAVLKETIEKRFSTLLLDFPGNV